MYANIGQYWINLHPGNVFPIKMEESFIYLYRPEEKVQLLTNTLVKGDFQELKEQTSKST